MNANSPSETLWEVLHHAGALLTDGGFAAPCPPLPAPAAGAAPGPRQAPSEGYGDLAARYADHLLLGTGWPAGTGPDAPQALILTGAPLSDGALTFVRTWFENPRVNLTVASDFFIQPLPELTGDRPPYAALARDLCALLRPKVILSLGPGPAQKLLGAPLSLDTLRSSDYRFDRWTLVTTSDPELFLTQAEDAQRQFKAQVWKDLQRMLGRLKYG